MASTGQAFEKATHSGIDWTSSLPETEWAIYRKLLTSAQAENIPFALGGAFAMAAHIGSFRNTKDLDLYVLPSHRRRMIGLATRLGMADYYSKVPYDRAWIYRATSDGVIIDLIWAMANHRTQIDEWWLSGPEIEMRGFRLKVLPVEVMLLDKLFIMQRDRCDWPEAMNLLYFHGRDLNWEVLLERLGDDTPLLGGALSVFRWLSPGVASDLPACIWERLDLPGTKARRLPKTEKRRVSLLDRRPWYGPARQRR